MDGRIGTKREGFREFDTAGINYEFIESTQEQIKFQEEIIASLEKAIVAREDAVPDAQEDSDKYLQELYAQMEEREHHVAWMKECINRVLNGEAPYAESFEQYKERVGSLYTENLTGETGGEELRVADVNDSLLPVEAFVV